MLCVICATPPMNDKIEFFLGGGDPTPLKRGIPLCSPNPVGAFGAFI